MIPAVNSTSDQRIPDITPPAVGYLLERVVVKVNLNDQKNDKAVINSEVCKEKCFSTLAVKSQNNELNHSFSQIQLTNSIYLTIVNTTNSFKDAVPESPENQETKPREKKSTYANEIESGHRSSELDLIAPGEVKTGSVDAREEEEFSFDDHSFLEGGDEFERLDSTEESAMNEIKAGNTFKQENVQEVKIVSENEIAVSEKMNVNVEALFGALYDHDSKFLKLNRIDFSVDSDLAVFIKTELNKLENMPKYEELFEINKKMFTEGAEQGLLLRDGRRITSKELAELLKNYERSFNDFYTVFIQKNEQKKINKIEVEGKQEATHGTVQELSTKPQKTDVKECVELRVNSNKVVISVNDMIKRVIKKSTEERINKKKEQNLLEIHHFVILKDITNQLLMMMLTKANAIAYDLLLNAVRVTSANQKVNAEES